MAYTRAWNETLDKAQQPRVPSQVLWQQIASSGMELIEKQKRLNQEIIESGVTFAIYQGETALDRPWACDVIPRVIEASEWQRVSAGLQQRLRALNSFIDDVYHAQKIFAAGIIPRDLLTTSVHFRQECVGMSPPEGLWAHISGCDLVRDADGQWLVLEDNLRVPSGVSYMLENRRLLENSAPEWFDAQMQSGQKVLANDGYIPALKQLCIDLAHANTKNNRDRLKATREADFNSSELIEAICVVVLTPGMLNSAYFEHAYLAKQLGAVLAEGSDLFVDENDVVWLKSALEPCRVDVIYRRVDDLFLDPEVFQPESTVGVPGLMRAWRAGHVALLNAPGAGVADDKVVYAYVPKMIEFYLGEKAILPNVPTYLCHEADNLSFVLKNLDKLVVKPANESGGYGMLIGPHSDAATREAFREKILANPRHYIAQPTLDLSCAPTITSKGIAPRHLDLRPFVLGASTSQPQGYVTVGGLTRVALKENSLVVNSSQGGGSKDTWIVGAGLQAAPQLRAVQLTQLKSLIPARHLELAYWWGRYGARLMASTERDETYAMIIDRLRYNLRGLRASVPEVIWTSLLTITMGGRMDAHLPQKQRLGNIRALWKNVWQTQGLLGLIAESSYELETWDAAARLAWTTHQDLKHLSLSVAHLAQVRGVSDMPTTLLLADSPERVLEKCNDWHTALAKMWE